MKNYFKLFSMLAIAMLVVMSSCEKDEETKSDQEYLTAGNWKITSVVLSPGIDIPGIGTITDIYDLFIEECNKDDLVKFMTNGTIVEDEGATKCDPDDPQTTSDGTWSLDGASLTMVYPDEDPDVVTIASINSSTLVIASLEVIDLGLGSNTYTVTVTMTLQ